MAVNVKALFYLTAALTDIMSNKAGATNVSPGRVINISSITSLDPKVEMEAIAGEGIGAWSYVPSKAYANSLLSLLCNQTWPPHLPAQTNTLLNLVP